MLFTGVMSGDQQHGTVSETADHCHVQTSDYAFAIAAAATWNRLLLKVRTATSTEQFFRDLKTHLFTLD